MHEFIRLILFSILGKKSHSGSKRDKERRGDGEKHKLSKEERRERKLKKKQKAVSSSTIEESPVKVRDRNQAVRGV